MTNSGRDLPDCVFTILLNPLVEKGKYLRFPSLSELIKIEPVKNGIKLTQNNEMAKICFNSHAKKLHFQY